MGGWGDWQKGREGVDGSGQAEREEGENRGRGSDDGLKDWES